MRKTEYVIMLKDPCKPEFDKSGERLIYKGKGGKCKVSLFVADIWDLEPDLANFIYNFCLIDTHEWVHNFLRRTGLICQFDTHSQEERFVLWFQDILWQHNIVINMKVFKIEGEEN